MINLWSQLSYWDINTMAVILQMVFQNAFGIKYMQFYSDFTKQCSAMHDKSNFICLMVFSRF